MLYRPALDPSTVYFAHDALDTLITNPLLVSRACSSIGPLLQKDYRGYPLLLALLVTLNGAKLRDDGEWDFTRANTERGNDFLCFTFGVLCLARVIEAICLGERVHFLNGFRERHSLQSVRERHRMHLIDDSIWTEVSFNDEQTAQFQSALEHNQLTRDPKKVDYIVKLGETHLGKAYLELGSILNIVSDGITGHPLAAEVHSPFDTIPDPVPPAGPLVDVAGNYVQLQRFWGYLLSGLGYELACQIGRLDYIRNDYRAPFNGAILYAPWGNFKEFSRLFRMVILGPTDSKSSASNVRYDLGMELLHLVVQQARNVHDIMPKVYELRHRLTPIRTEIARHGLTDKLMTDAVRCFLYTKEYRERKENGIKLSGKLKDIAGVEASIRADSVAMLFKPLTFSSTRQVLYFVADRYDRALAMTDDLFRLAERHVSSYPLGRQLLSEWDIGRKLDEFEDDLGEGILGDRKVDENSARAFSNMMKYFMRTTAPHTRQ